MTTENTPRPDDARFPEPAQGDSLEMPEPTPVVADDGEVVSVHDDPVAAVEQDPEVVTGASDGSALTGEAEGAAAEPGAAEDPYEAIAASASRSTGSSRYTDEQLAELAGLSHRVEAEDADDVAVGATGPAADEDPIVEEDVVEDLAADENLDVESLREPSEAERSWDYSNGPLEQVGPVQPTVSPRDEEPDVLEQDGTEGDDVPTAALTPTALRRRSLFSTEEEDEAAATTTLPAEGVDDGAPTSTMPVAAAEDVEPTSTYLAQGVTEDPAPTTIEPGSGAAGAVAVGTAAATGASASGSAGKAARSERPRTEDDVILDGSSVVGKPASRAGAHWAGILLSIVLLPAAWFLIHHGEGLLSESVKAYFFGRDTRGLVELGVGALVLAIALWTARRSSVGSFVMGVLTLAVGVVGLAVPDWANQTVTPFLSDLSDHSSLGSDLATYFWTDVATGRFAVIGLALIVVGVISHSSRRAGRREQEVVDRVRRA